MPSVLQGEGTQERQVPLPQMPYDTYDAQP